MTAPTPLNGLVLAGGAGTRMGEDKGGIVYRGEPHVAYLFRLLSGYCERVFVSINAAQLDRPIYAELPVIVDAGAREGPAAGLLSARHSFPDVAWLAVAVDLARLDEATVAALVAGRRANAAATAFRHRDGTLEPLCAIWEPLACAVLERRAAAGDRSARRCLEACETEVLACPNPQALRSVDTPQARAALTRKIGRRP